MPRPLERSRFAFLVHALTPLHRKVLAARSRRWRLLAGRTDGTDPNDVRHVCTVRLRSGNRLVEGSIVGIPLLPEQLIADQPRSVELMRRAVAEAGGGIDAIGLGSVLAVVAGRGAGLQEHVWQPVTTGAAATAWAASENARTAARALGIWPEGPIGLLGFTGTVGTAVALRLKDMGAEQIRVDATGRSARRAAESGLLSFPTAPEVVAGCRLVVGAATTGRMLDPRAMAQRSVLVDIALPPTLSGPPPPGVLVLAGESVALPAGYRRGGWGTLYHLFAGYGPTHLFACVVEPLILALEQQRSPFAQGRGVEQASVQAFGELAEREGFRPVLARRWREVAPRSLDV